MSPRPRFVLASASPARLATLRAAGMDPEVIVSDVAEDGITEPTPAATAQRLAELKAAAVAGRLADSEGAVVLGCDSLLELDGRALGKPVTPDVARARWQAMRGRAGILHTGHCVIQPATGRRVGEVASTTVYFADVSNAEIDAYVATGEPLWVAGAFTVDGLGGAFVERIDGDHHNVVGVSLPLLRRLLAELGIAWPSLWTKD
ncbi:MAG TPA: nucleoside triphosphate pyrophosphatase [Sporichthyaceae bacterium]